MTAMLAMEATTDSPQQGKSADVVTVTKHAKILPKSQMTEGQRQKTGPTGKSEALRALRNELEANQGLLMDRSAIAMEAARRAAEDRKTDKSKREHKKEEWHRRQEAAEREKEERKARDREHYIDEVAHVDATVKGEMAHVFEATFETEVEHGRYGKIRYSYSPTASPRSQPGSPSVPRNRFQLMETADEGSEDEASDRLDDEDEPGRSGGREQERSEFIDADAPAPAPQKSANQKESGSSGRDNTAVQKDSGSPQWTGTVPHVGFRVGKLQERRKGI
jgi:hypothetical protein